MSQVTTGGISKSALAGIMGVGHFSDMIDAVRKDALKTYMFPDFKKMIRSFRGRALVGIILAGICFVLTLTQAVTGALAPVIYWASFGFLILAAAEAFINSIRLEITLSVKKRLPQALKDSTGWMVTLPPWIKPDETIIKEVRRQLEMIYGAEVTDTAFSMMKVMPDSTLEEIFKSAQALNS